MDNELTFYNILYEIVKGWPATHHSGGAEERFKRLNTFAVIEDQPQVFAQNMGKDSRYKPGQSEKLFYSRWWDHHNFIDSELKKDFPALLVWEEPSTLKQPFSNGEYEVLRLRACIQGLYVSKYDNTQIDYSRGGYRSVEEIKAQLRLLRSQLHAELTKWVRVDAQLTAGGSQTAWYNKDYLDTLIPDTISSYTKKIPLTSFLSIGEAEVAVISGLDQNGTVGAYMSWDLQINPCMPVTINYTATENVEQLDHPNKASA